MVLEKVLLHNKKKQNKHGEFKNDSLCVSMCFYADKTRYVFTEIVMPAYAFWVDVTSNFPKEFEGKKYGFKNPKTLLSPKFEPALVLEDEQGVENWRDISSMTNHHVSDVTGLLMLNTELLKQKYLFLKVSKHIEIYTTTELNNPDNIGFLKKYENQHYEGKDYFTAIDTVNIFKIRKFGIKDILFKIIRDETNTRFLGNNSLIMAVNVIPEIKEKINTLSETIL